MANEGHLKILKQGVDVWNKWRKENPDIEPDLSAANLREAQLTKADFSRADLRMANFSRANLSFSNLAKANLSPVNLSKASLYGAVLRGADLSFAILSDANINAASLDRANLQEANLCGATLSWARLREADLRKANLNKAKLSPAFLNEADLREANLVDADLGGANLVGADLRKANLREAKLHEAKLHKADLCKAHLPAAKLIQADLSEANLNKANLFEADLSRADLSRTILVETNFTKANLTNSRVYGISAWDLVLDNATQIGFIITKKEEPVITVDNLEVAQFVYLLLNRKKLRNVIKTITSKSVLILGRFTPERKTVLDAMATELREHDLIPIIFDFERAESRDFTETIKTLAGMSFFVIADITNPSSAPLELQATVPDYQIPFVAILEKGEPPFSMLNDLLKYPWVLPLLEYKSSDDLIKTFKKAIIDEAFSKHKELLVQKAEKMKTRTTEDYLKDSE